MPTNNTKPRPVDFFRHDEDFECAYMGALGFSTRAILQIAKGLTSGQINYRLKKAQIRRMDYRNGVSHVALTVLKGFKPTVQRMVTNHLKTGAEL